MKPKEKLERMFTLPGVIDMNCPNLLVQEDSTGYPAISICKLMHGRQEHEGNCGMYQCPIGKKKKN